jgi:hypothetical protein
MLLGTGRRGRGDQQDCLSEVGDDGAARQASELSGLETDGRLADLSGRFVAAKLGHVLPPAGVYAGLRPRPRQFSVHSLRRGATDALH